MSTLRINILNPRAAKLLQDLADLNLIAIQDDSQNGFFAVLDRLRAKSALIPSIEDITKEVETVRTKRHAK